MIRIDWSPAMELGIPDIDRAHREFVEALNTIVEAPDDAFSARLAKLVAKIEQDFAEEERLMEAIDFPAMHSHVEQHARVLSGLHHAVFNVMDGDIAVGRRVIELLFSWFQVHLSTMDLALAVAAEVAAAERLLPVAAPLENDAERIWHNIGS